MTIDIKRYFVGNGDILSLSLFFSRSLVPLTATAVIAGEGEGGVEREYPRYGTTLLGANRP